MILWVEGAVQAAGEVVAGKGQGAAARLAWRGGRVLACRLAWKRRATRGHCGAGELARPRRGG